MISTPFRGENLADVLDLYVTVLYRAQLLWVLEVAVYEHEAPVAVWAMFLASSEDLLLTSLELPYEPLLRADLDPFGRSLLHIRSTGVPAYVTYGVGGDGYLDVKCVGFLKGYRQQVYLAGACLYATDCAARKPRLQASGFAGGGMEALILYRPFATIV